MVYTRRSRWLFEVLNKNANKEFCVYLAHWGVVDEKYLLFLILLSSLNRNRFPTVGILFRSCIFLIDLDLQGQILLESRILPHFEHVRTVR